MVKSFGGAVLDWRCQNQVSFLLLFPALSFSFFSPFLFYSLSSLSLTSFSFSFSSSLLNQSISQHMFMETPFSDQCYWGVEERHDGKSVSCPQKRGMMGSPFPGSLKSGRMGSLFFCPQKRVVMGGRLAPSQEEP